MKTLALPVLQKGHQRMTEKIMTKKARNVTEKMARNVTGKTTRKMTWKLTVVR